MVRMFCGAAVMVVCAAIASGQFLWSDGFESYVPGALCSQSGCANQANAGGWTGWDNNPGVAGSVVTAATSIPTVIPHTGNKCLKISASSDCIQPFSLNYPSSYPTTGLYELSAWTYIPSSLTASSWMIVNTVYNHNGPYAWALNLEFTPAGRIRDPIRGGLGANLIYSQWIQVRLIIDLTHDSMACYYNGTYVTAGAWYPFGGPVVLAIANIDLYTGGTMFYDDIMLRDLPGLYQINSPGASFDFDGVNGDWYTRASVSRTSTVCGGASVTANLSSSNIGSGWDIALTIGPGVSLDLGGLDTTHGQIVNINTLDPSFTFANALAFGTPFGNAAIPLSLMAPFGVTAQMVVLDQTNADGFALSQMTELHVVAGPTSVPGPLLDDSAVVIPLSTPALCNAGMVTFFGITYSAIGVTSNGRVLFGTSTPSASPLPSPAGAMTDDPFVGAWCDLDPGSSGVGITILAPTNGILRVEYTGIPYSGSFIHHATFGIQFDSSNGVVQIDSLNQIDPYGTPQFLGISRGAGGATNPGARAFGVGGPFAVANATDMIYAFGNAGSLAPGMSMLQFYPDGNGYTWYGL